MREEGGKWTVEWGEDTELLSTHNEAGRGMELSELVDWGGELFTVDDRTGIIYQVQELSRVVPRFIAMEGDGDTDKGQKSEWATVKDGELVVGSFGKEYVNAADGSIKNRNNLWVTVVSNDGTLRHEDWTSQYDALREVTHTQYPGYMIQEAILWSSSLRKWLVLPRRVSTEAYDEVADERRGSNILLLASEDFSDVELREITTLVPERGFSSATELPTAGVGPTQALICLRSEENSAQGTQDTYLSILALDGSGPLLEETLVPGHMK